MSIFQIEKIISSKDFNLKMKIGFLSDIHEDITSLQKALRLLEQEKVDSIICLGDIVGFATPFYKYITTKDADLCVKLVKANCSHTVAGNHDLYALKKTPLFNSDFNYGDNWYSLEYEKRVKLAKNKIWLYEDSEVPSALSDESKDFLNGLDEYKCIQFDGLNIFISHFCYPDFSGSTIFFPAEFFHLNKHFEFAGNLNCKISFSGHGHPEGSIYVDNEKFKLLTFGSHEINNENCWLVTPCIANTSRKNGVFIFNTTDFTIKTVPLNNN